MSKTSDYFIYLYIFEEWIFCKLLNMNVFLRSLRLNLTNCMLVKKQFYFETNDKFILYIWGFTVCIKSQPCHMAVAVTELITGTRDVTI